MAKLKEENWLTESFTVCFLTGLLQGQWPGAMWLVASPGQNDEGRGNFITVAHKKNFKGIFASTLF